MNNTCNNQKKAIWITWENHRRSRELSKQFNAKLYTLECGLNYFVRTFINIIRTLLVIVKEKPLILFVQNPSMSLAFIACMYKKFFKYKLIVDRHSNFRLKRRNSKSIKYIIFHAISDYTIKHSDFTIVTNEYLKNLVNEFGGQGVVLPDKLPVMQFKNSKRYELKTANNIVYICSFSGDEPIDEVLAAAMGNEKRFSIYITGKPSKKYQKTKNDNVFFTGFLDEESYQSLLAQVHAILVLTNMEHVLLCGAYEAVSLRKPLILSNKKTLKDYFNHGVLFTNNTRESILSNIDVVIDNNLEYEKAMEELHEIIDKRWNILFEGLRTELLK